mmetsp:Transcript_4686/g.5861  ORF Transcript_4686/g.5861 Transcript_4686/m.5861 type:complete len:133 (-) Transcript_4686:531-929(-)
MSNELKASMLPLSRPRTETTLWWIRSSWTESATSNAVLAARISANQTQMEGRIARGNLGEFAPRVTSQAHRSPLQLPTPLRPARLTFWPQKGTQQLLEQNVNQTMLLTFAACTKSMVIAPNPSQMDLVLSYP